MEAAQMQTLWSYGSTVLCKASQRFCIEKIVAEYQLLKKKASKVRGK